MELTTLKCSSRGTQTNNALRADGLVPAVFYGKDKEPVQITVSAMDLSKVYGPGQHYTLLDLEIDGKGGNPALVHETQKDIIKGDVLHVDFLAIAEDTKVKVDVPIRLEGTAYGVKTEGASLFAPTRKIKIKCLPSQIPSEFVVDISEFRANHTHYLQDVDLGGAEAVTAPRAVLVTLGKGRKQ